MADDGSLLITNSFGQISISIPILLDCYGQKQPPTSTK